MQMGKGEKLGTAHLLLDEESLRKFETKECTVNTTVQELSYRLITEQELTRERLRTVLENQRCVVEAPVSI